MISLSIKRESIKSPFYAILIKSFAKVGIFFRISLYEVK
ncbi:putative membrane protein [Bacteroides fragilis str. S6L8]|jgi:hypothetical protein|nr:putative membrane protein [Bacteroides fragilis str. 2-F-2 \